MKRFSQVRIVIGCIAIFLLGYYVKSNYQYWIGPELVLETDLHDFGMIESGKPARFYIRFKNDGLMPLSLKDASSDCGCTVVNWKSDAIGRGKTDSVLVEYDTSKSGLINRIVTIQSNSPDSPHSFYVIGNVVPEGADYLQGEDD